MAQKADVTLQLAEAAQLAAVGLKAGQTLQLRTSQDGAVECSTDGGALLGQLPQEQCTALIRSAASGTVRSIRRAPGGGGHIAAITLRVVAAAPPPFAPLQGWDDASRKQEVDADDDFRLPRGSLELLAASQEVRELLKHEALRTAIAAVDASARPEQALEKALQNPDFEAFAEQVLITIGRSPPKVAAASSATTV